MKKVVKNILEIGVLIVLLIGAFKLINLQDSKEEKNAINRCNGKNNIVTHYTQEGDKYYTCK